MKQSKHIRYSLTTPGSLQNAIKALENYSNTINIKTKNFLDRLLSIGISTAIENSGKYASYISFKKEIVNTTNGFDAVLIATDGQKIVREWMRGGEIVSAEVSPLLMAEFGSGWLAEVLPNESEVEGLVGQGTFPGQTHAFDPFGWYWKDTEGNTHHSRGEEPTYPMYYAVSQMMLNIDRIAREEFNK